MNITIKKLIFPKESAAAQNSNESLQNKTNFLESAHRLEEYLRRNENLKDVENPLKELFVMKEFFLDTNRTNDRHQSHCNRGCKFLKAIHNAQKVSLDDWRF